MNFSHVISQAMFSQICNHCSLGIIVLNADRKLVFWNQWMADTSGFESGDVLGATLEEIFPNLDTPRLTDAIDSAYTYGFSSVLSPRLHPNVFPFGAKDSAHGDSQPMGQMTTVAPLPGSQEDVFCMIQINDVTAALTRETTLRRQTRSLVETVEELNVALESEKKFSALQRKFISLVSHEFRTPLAIIDGAAQRLARRRTELTPEVLQEKTDKIRNAVMRMTDLIENTLYAARLEENVIEMHPIAADLGGMLRELSALHSDISPQHNITIDVDGLPQSITADKDMLVVIFSNLLSNAIKFSPDSSAIEVKGWTEGEYAMVSVSDFGIGIPEDELPNMFERFFRTRAAEGIKGTGIGLNVSKEFVEMQGGDIAVTSRAGEGSSFTVRLPINGKGL